MALKELRDQFSYLKMELSMRVNGKNLLSTYAYLYRIVDSDVRDGKGI